MREMLRDQAAEFDLSKGSVAFRLGRTTFELLAYYGDKPGIIFRDDFESNLPLFEKLGVADDFLEANQTVNADLPNGILLYEGECVEIGRKKGIRVITEGVYTDTARTRLHDWRPLERAMKADDRISRSHAIVLAITPEVARIRDLGSTNGTHIL